MGDEGESDGVGRKLETHVLDKTSKAKQESSLTEHEIIGRGKDCAIRSKRQCGDRWAIIQRGSRKTNKDTWVPGACGM